MRAGGVSRAFFVLRKGKWDIPEYYGDGSAFGIDLGYLIVGRPYGPACIPRSSLSVCAGHTVAVGFPDILFEPRLAFRRALAQLDSTKTDLVLGLYRAHDIRIWDMVVVDRKGRVRELLIRPDKTKTKLGWVFAVWSPKFTEFMHEYLAVPRTATEQPGSKSPREVTVGEVIQAAVREGLSTQSVVFPVTLILTSAHLMDCTKSLPVVLPAKQWPMEGSRCIESSYSRRRIRHSNKEESAIGPKPMIEIGHRRILWHIMKIYTAYGLTDFIICCGYKGHVIKEYFANYFLRNADMTLRLRQPDGSASLLCRTMACYFG